MESHDYSENPFSGCCWPYPGADINEARDFLEKYGGEPEVSVLYKIMLRQLAKDYAVSDAELIARFEEAHQRVQGFRKALNLNP